MKPFAMGAAMAAAMIWMLHERIMSGTFDLTRGGVAFVMAHIGVFVALGTLGIFVPTLRKLVIRHRPSFGHVAFMALGMLVIAGSIHLVMHGAIV